jgi:hypothetical protein
LGISSDTDDEDYEDSTQSSIGAPAGSSVHHFSSFVGIFGLQPRNENVESDSIQDWKPHEPWAAIDLNDDEEYSEPESEVEILNSITTLRARVLSQAFSDGGLHNVVTFQPKWSMVGSSDTSSLDQSDEFEFAHGPQIQLCLSTKIREKNVDGMYEMVLQIEPQVETTS